MSIMLKIEDDNFFAKNALNIDYKRN